METPQMSAAYQELERMDTQIEQAKANIRVLDAIGDPMAVQLRSQLSAAEQKRRDVMLAIDAERGKTN